MDRIFLSDTELDKGIIFFATNFEKIISTINQPVYSKLSVKIIDRQMTICVPLEA